MNIVAVVNQKGGVAKTTTCANLGACLAEQGLRVLLVDLDPQANLTLGLRGGCEKGLPYGLPDVLLNPATAPLAGIIGQVEGLPLFLAPGHVEMARTEAVLGRTPATGRRLQDALAPLGDAYDWVFLDCPPSLGPLTQNAVVASTYLLVPTWPAMYAFAGMDVLNTMITDLAREYRVNARLLGILLTMYERGTRMHRAISSVIRERFEGMVFETVIYKNIRLAEAEIEGKPIILFDTRASGAQSYRALAEEVLRRIQPPDGTP